LGIKEATRLVERQGMQPVGPLRRLEPAAELQRLGDDPRLAGGIPSRGGDRVGGAARPASVAFVVSSRLRHGCRGKVWGRDVAAGIREGLLSRMCSLAPRDGDWQDGEVESRRLVRSARPPCGSAKRLHLEEPWLMRVVNDASAWILTLPLLVLPTTLA